MSTKIDEVKKIMGENFIGFDELKELPEGFKVKADSDIEIPFSVEELSKKKDTHILILCPSHFADGTAITIQSIRSAIEKKACKTPVFYNQDWYYKEDFYRATIQSPHWLLLQKSVDDSTRGVAPEKLEAEHSLPMAAELTFSFFACYFCNNGEKLWNHDYVWCKDRDNIGDQIYVGRYTDPYGINADGFEIHRHLSIKKCYGALV